MTQKTRRQRLAAQRWLRGGSALGFGAAEHGLHVPAAPSHPGEVGKLGMSPQSHGVKQ